MHDFSSDTSDSKLEHSYGMTSSLLAVISIAKTNILLSRKDTKISRKERVIQVDFGNQAKQVDAISYKDITGVPY